jgi:pseudaminic acid biosynthesis-associated methylase
MKNEKTYQIKKWESEFGKEFIERNTFSPEELDKSYFDRYGITKTEMINIFLKELPKNAKILEVGTNIGNQLIHLQKMGFTNLYGIEVQENAINYSKQRADNLNIIKADAMDIPFKDDYFDLVFTNVVLIHIPPNILDKVLSEIIRVSNSYILGLEYYSEKCEEISYRGEDNLLWKNDFLKAYTQVENSLTLIKEKKYSYKENDSLIDNMFLLKKV